MWKKQLLKKIIQERNENWQGIKVRMNLICLMATNVPYTKIEMEDKAHFSSKQEIILEGTNEKMLKKILESFATFQNKGNGWRFKKIVKLELYISKYRIIGRSS